MQKLLILLGVGTNAPLRILLFLICYMCSRETPCRECYCNTIMGLSANKILKGVINTALLIVHA